MLRWLQRKKNPRVLVIGLDCVPPNLVFDEFRDDMPTLSKLAGSGTCGTLESSVPCITVPAWSSMLSSRDPGTLGIYGFRNRADHTYDSLQVADATAVKVPRIWDILSAAEKNSIIVGVPQTYPVRPLNGHMVSGFLTPGTGSAFTYPAILKSEVLKHFPGYTFDAKGFRTNDKTWLRQTISDVTEVQFGLFRHLLQTKPRDFAMFVNMGTDRIHHGFWRYHDPQHRLYEPDHPLNGTIREYYKQVDSHIADILAAVDDDTIVMIVSDHGVTRMDGAICINQWLWREGWLALKTPPPPNTIIRFEDADIDWQNTRAWSTGGYYGRIFLNIQGREPLGTIPPQQLPDVRAELAAALKAIPAPDGTPLNTQVFEPEQIYAQTSNIPPDLMVYFGDLHWRCVGGIGYDAIYTFENDTGPDDANHHPDGMFLLYNPNHPGRGEIPRHQLMDIAPTLLHLLNIDIPDNMQGKIINTTR